MKPSQKYNASIVLNIILAVLFCCTIVVATANPVLPDQQLRDQLIRLQYPAGDYQAYLVSVDAGLVMNYETYLHKKYPIHFIDQEKQGPVTRYLRVREVSDEEIRRAGDLITKKELTNEELSLYPLLGNIFVADVPFSLIPAYRYELASLKEFTKKDILLVWNNKTYRIWEQEV